MKNSFFICFGFLSLGAETATFHFSRKSGHWEGWHLGIPAIGYIVLNKSLDKAVAEVVEEYNGSGVLLHKTHSDWKEVGGLYHWEE